LRNICRAIKSLANSFPKIEFVFPVHLNPTVSEEVRKVLDRQNNIRLLNPLPYDEFVLLMANSIFIITDSGGIQEESVSLGKTALVCRDETERQEGVSTGFLKIVGQDTDKIIDTAVSLLADKKEIHTPLLNPFGSPGVSKLIAEVIVERLQINAV
jgi:UDP-N-acetylglucosamine 2-epimerase (non-hydrolysing)